ncbi:hypothetical protein DSO57_1000741 [Entomophthora muscae]|uniref:Uncharacterized protein n=1 Tax=Entomophthora muscae TaxID=34485 RepID=A0ACC2T8V9_9FUNG|nr:hypothetical protein DSO57_1000741 [Entomophthora muscae]
MEGIGAQDPCGKGGPASGTLFLAPPNVNFMPANFVAPPLILETTNGIPSQCPEFYTEDALMLSQVIYLGLLWFGLLVLLNPGVTIGNSTKKYLKPQWWLIINSIWIWVIIPHHLETASYYPVISVTVVSSDLTQGAVVMQYCVALLCGGDLRRLLTCLCLAADVVSISGEMDFVVLQIGDNY